MDAVVGPPNVCRLVGAVPSTVMNFVWGLSTLMGALIGFALLALTRNGPATCRCGVSSAVSVENN